MMPTIGLIWPILPGLILAVTALMLLLAGVFQGEKNTPLISYTTVLALIAASLTTIVRPVQASTFGFSGFLVENIFTDYAQVFVMLTSAVVLLSFYRQLEQDQLSRFELPVLLLFSTLGMLLMIAANDFLMFFVGLELQTLPIYVLVAMRSQKSAVSEAAVKYFILGVLSTVFILYGISFIYGYVGTTEFSGVALGLSGISGIPLPLVLAFVFLLAGIAFKISVVPFHMWTPDVYEGSPTAITLFIASAPKVAAMVFFIRLLFGPLDSYVEVWQPLVQILSVLSMTVGVFGALFQDNIKRLIAYSTIANMGYMLLGIASVSIEGVQAVLVYLFLYIIMTIGAFGCLLNLRRMGEMPEYIDDLKGLSKTSPKIALIFAIMMFSLAGIPPLAGFFAKLMVFMAAVDAGLYPLVIVAVLTTVVGAAYYLRIVKVMYFDEPLAGEAELSYDRRVSRATGIIIAAAAVINVFFFILPGPVMSKAEEAASVLFMK